MSEVSSQAAAPAYRVLLYYKFVPVADPTTERANHEALCRSLNLRGRILIAPEGINGTVSGTVADTEAYMAVMQAHPLFGGTAFKIDPHTGHAFRKLNVRLKRELVALGVDEPYDVSGQTGQYIEPDEMRQLMENTPEDVVILDTRSNFEYVVGRFKGAIHLDLDHFRELPAHLQALEDLKGKKLVTYCTGGIRCEKATSWLLAKGFPADKLYQLHGGIIRYGHEQGGKGFDGQCYVFDDRVLVPVNQVDPAVIATCHHCGSPTERMVNCANADCNTQIVMCEACGWQHAGTCSTACYESPRRRVYDGTGQYHRGETSKRYVLREQPLRQRPT